MSEREDSRNIQSEIQRPKEALAIRFNGLTISGRSGTGKTAVSEILASNYFIAPERVIKTGQLIREASDSGQDVQSFIERDERVDKKLDRMQREIIVSSTPLSPFVLEGRLAGVIASEEKAKVPQINVVSLLFVARADIRYRRMLNRHLSKRQKEIDEALARMATPDEIEDLLENFRLEKERMTIENVRSTEREREASDLERWRKLYPQLKGIDPFSTANKDAYGKPIYDFIIDTRPSIDDVFKQIHQLLKSNHLIIAREDFGPGAAGDLSFRTVADGATCEAYLDREKEEKCDKISVGTLDVDISANLELFPYCSKSHLKQLRRTIKADLEKQGKYSVFAVNGFGRS